jgi:uncharacterized protein YuzE
MKLNYFPETDSLYIDLSEKPSVESQEVSAGVVLDYDAEGNLAGIDIDHASKKLDLIIEGRVRGGRSRSAGHGGYGVASKHLTFPVELFSILLGLLY